MSPIGSVGGITSEFCWQLKGILVTAFIPTIIDELNVYILGN